MAENQVRSVDTMLDSTLESVDTAETLVLQVATEGGFEEEDLHKIGMAVRETMVNAVVHGNRYNLNKKVYLSVERNGDKLVVTIRDEGEGFDRKSVPDPLAEENLLRHSGRGLLLMKAFVDEFDIGKAESGGTEVRLVKWRGSANEGEGT